MARVTWLVPVLNGMPYLRQTLASIESQTFKDWQILAWDNGSSDGSQQELERWIPDRIPGTCILNQPMRSLGKCRALMVEGAATEFCACIDADDVNFSDRLSAQVEFLDAHPEVAVVGTQTEKIDREGQPLRDNGEFALDHADMVHALLYCSPLANPSVAFRRAEIMDVGNYRDVGPINVEDYDLWLRVAAVKRLANLPRKLLQYRVHEQSTTQRAIAARKLEPAGHDRLCEHAPQLFGCAAGEMRLLATKAHRCAIVALFRIARHLARTQGGHALLRMRRNSFIQAARHLTAPNDVLTRIVLAVLHEGSRAIPRRLWAKSFGG